MFAQATTKAAMTFITMAVVATTAHAGWQQTFNDDFSGTTLSPEWIKTDRWGQQNLPPTGEQQCYLDNNVQVSGGFVSLVATDIAPSNCSPNPGNLFYSSGMIATANFQQTYGYFEIRAKLPRGTGLWSAFRLARVADNIAFQRPEIFAMEGFGDTVSEVNQRYNFFDGTNQPVDEVNTFADADFSADFHTFGIDWQPGLLIYYVDGIERFRFQSPFVYTLPMYPILNLAVGGTEAGPPNLSTPFPATLQIDYFRAYARINDGQPDVNPPGADTQAPRIKILKPTRKDKVKPGQKIEMSAATQDNVGVASVTFWMGSQQVCTFTKAPYTCTVTIPKTTDSDDSGHDHNEKRLVFRAFARDSAGNVGRDAVVVKIRK